MQKYPPPKIFRRICESACYKIVLWLNMHAKKATISGRFVLVRICARENALFLHHFVLSVDALDMDGIEQCAKERFAQSK